jgi:hypothetical protein
VLDTQTLPLGSILTFDQRTDKDLRLDVTVRDENVEDVLEFQARLSVVGQPPYVFICPDDKIATTGQVNRMFQVVIDPQKLKPGACTKVEVVVSKRFAGNCMQYFGLPDDPDDVAHANYWIWEVSSDPGMFPIAAQQLLTSCQTLSASQGTPAASAEQR